MKKATINLLVIYLLSMNCTTIKAQSNLVPNPSFEDTVHCPYANGQVTGFVKYWFVATPSPDYFNACSSAYGTPLNSAGYQVPRNGKAYIGAGEYLDNGNGPNSKEYFQVKLDAPLQAGKRYCVKFYVSLADSSMYAIKCMGALFTKDTLPNITLTNNIYVPQVKYNDTAWLDSKTDWMKISGSFIAVGGEDYLTLGCFTKNTATSYELMPIYANWCNAAYYYFDDVSVTLCDSDNTNKKDANNLFIPNVFTPNGDGINDTFIIQLPATNTNSSLQIYNRWGTLVFKQINTDKMVWNGFTKAGKKLSDGIYYYLLKYSNNGKIINKKGVIQLLN